MLSGLSLDIYMLVGELLGSKEFEEVLLCV
jgi:hypothetical protein